MRCVICKSPDPDIDDGRCMDCISAGIAAREEAFESNRPAKTEGLIKEWRERAHEYDERDREATRRKEYIIAAQQAGIACALRLCANDLEAWPEMMKWREKQTALTPK